jgi:hypothetical protein
MVSRCDRIRVLQTASARHITARDRRQTFPEVGPVWSRSAQRTKKSHSSLRGVKRRSNPGAARIKRWIASLTLAMTKDKKEAERRKAQSPTAAPCGAALLLREQHTSRRSTAVLAQGTAHPEGSAQARLRGRQSHKRRVAPASTAPSSSDAPRAPVIVPAGMMPEPPECAGDEPTPAGTALAPLTAVSSQRPSRERDSPKM